ncbi:hypothetical protein B0J17DRAFT_295380 [Rhizoctonia solani]|nr:hypothetical protein B0J17DRAFT_295380 [Rhizoctonia solani]
MILDADSPPKSPVTSRPTVRQSPSSPLRHVTTAFPYPRDARANTIYSETTSLLYDRAPQSMYDDQQPPAYDDINGTSQKMSARRRLWARCVVALLIVLGGVGSFSAYHLKNRTIPTQPSRDPVKEPMPTNLHPHPRCHLFPSFHISQTPQPPTCHQRPGGPIYVIHGLTHLSITAQPIDWCTLSQACYPYTSSQRRSVQPHQANSNFVQTLTNQFRANFKS